MKKTLTEIQSHLFPALLHPLLEGVRVYDSSSSPASTVWFIDREDGFYLKSSAPGALETEATMTRYFHSRGLGAEVLEYIRDEKDWLLTRRLPGDDCVDQLYLSDPKKLCDTTALLLRQLHEVDCADCPVNHTAKYIHTARENHRRGNYDTALFPDNWGYTTVEEAHAAMEAAAPYLKSDALVHGDYCLPNIILNNWKFSGFIDLECSGLGDRHIDLHWGIWSLGFNLKTNAFKERFLDAYGRDQIEPELLDAIGAFEVFGK